MWRFARRRGIVAELKRLHQPSLWRSLSLILTDWGIIFAALTATMAWGPAAVPFAVLVIGNRQRALGNLLHDAAHGSLGRHRCIAELIARVLLFGPMWTSIDLYRREHFAHHRRLGSPASDVDLIHCDSDMGRFWLGLLWTHLSNPRTWSGSAFGHLLRAGHGGFGVMLASWAGLFGALECLLGPYAGFVFAGLWLASRATVFHAITTFREISDHVGLRPGSLIGFTRNHTAKGPLAALLHPHNNGYHLAHHLNPGMPSYALPRAHKLLLQWPEYAVAAHCRSYFTGASPAVASWVRTPPRKSHERDEARRSARTQSGNLFRLKLGRS